AREAVMVRFRPLNDNAIMIKSPREIEAMRESARRLKILVKDLVSFTKVGVTAKEIDAYAGQRCRDLDVKSGAYGYGGANNRFPGYICISPNETVVQAIPGSRRLEDGDILSLDVAVRPRGCLSCA